jgi:4a-hydroxytetrahydrobiopterin dehydratase
MAKRDRLSDDAMTTFLSAHPGWAATDNAPWALTRTFSFSDYASGIAFVVRVARAADERDHHPDLHVSWGKVRVDWSTHDAGGITGVDAEMAEVTERLYKNEEVS